MLHPIVGLGAELDRSCLDSHTKVVHKSTRAVRPRSLEMSDDKDFVGEKSKEFQDLQDEVDQLKHSLKTERGKNADADCKDLI